jgi:hypothetical protein
LYEHRDTAQRFPNRATSKRLLECGEHVQIVVMETVPINGDWRERERHWISLLRYSFPGGTNVSDGGDGVPGLVHSEATRAKISATKKGVKGKPLSPETRAKISASHKGKKLSAESIAKRTATRKGYSPSPETRAKMSAANKGNKFSQGRKLTPEHVARLRAGHKAYYNA